MASSFNPHSGANAPYMSAPDCLDIRHIPGETGLPVIGNVPEIIRDIDGFLARRVERFGHLSRMALGPQTGILVTHPDHLQQVLLDSGQNFSSTMGYHDSVGRFYGDSIITQDFADHKASRRVFQTAFKRPALAGYVDVMNQSISEHVARWGDPGDFRYVAATRRLLIDIAARVFFGLNPGSGEIRRMERAFHEINHVGLMAILKWNVPGTKFWRGLRGKRDIETMIADIAAERRADPGPDLTSIIASERDDNGEFWPIELLLVHLSMLLFAAHDTTAGATSNLMMYLAKPEHQQWQQRLRDEALSLDTDAPDIDDLDRLELMEQCINEAIRLHPAVGSIMRRTVRDCRIGELALPAHTMLFNMVHWVHRSPEYWTEPNRFDPERFSDTRREHKKHSFQFVPFGGGAHKCIGMHVAMINAKLILFHSLKHYRFDYQDGYDGAYQVLPLPFPKKDLPLLVSSA